MFFYHTPAFLGTERFQHIHEERIIVSFDEGLQPTNNCPLVSIRTDFAVFLDLLINITVHIKAAKVGHQLLPGRCNSFGSWLFHGTLIQKLLGSTRTSVSHLALTLTSALLSFPSPCFSTSFAAACAASSMVSPSNEASADARVLL
jgi:hypothetical protein